MKNYIQFENGSDLQTSIKMSESHPGEGWVEGPDEVEGKHFKLVNGSPVEYTTTEFEALMSSLAVSSAWSLLRNKRDALLTDCDWTQGDDVTLSVKTAWADYRQLLRDLPQTTEDPANPVWPTQPVN